MRGLVRTVCYKSMDIRELLDYLVVNIIKRNTVMYIARSNFHCQNHTVNIAGSMSFIGQLLLVVPFYEQATVRVGSADGDGFLLCFLLALL